MSKLNSLYLATKIRVNNFFTKENGEVNIVATVVLIGIAVALAVVFKDEIGKLVKKLLKSISSKATDAATGEI